MKNKEFVAALASRLGWSTQEVSETLSVLGAVIGSRLVDNDSICLQGFGRFEVKKKMERISVNPSNGKRYLVPPKLVPVFRPGISIKHKLKSLENDE